MPLDWPETSVNGTYICCWCEKGLPASGAAYEWCPHCYGSFAFGKPILVAAFLGEGI